MAGWGGVQGAGLCPPLVAEVDCESVEARMQALVVQAYYKEIGLEGWAVPDGEA